MKVIESELIGIDLRHKKINENLKILDIGGGGEGVISQLYGNQVTAIDIREDELDEISKTESLKLIMNASDMSFYDNQFELVTSFFSFMYMRDSEIQPSILEMYRVLKPGGKFEIWDMTLPSNTEVAGDVLIAQLSINLPDRTITTSYGVGLSFQRRDEQFYKELIDQSGLCIKECRVGVNGDIYINGWKENFLASCFH